MSEDDVVNVNREWMVKVYIIILYVYDFKLYIFYLDI